MRSLGRPGRVVEMQFTIPSLKRAPVPHPLQAQLDRFKAGYPFDEWSRVRNMRPKEMGEA
jgi:methyl coenzyme M reductase subunit C-like uncharacterized protein (methanogenesis marker protein 7)